MLIIHPLCFDYILMEGKCQVEGDGYYGAVHLANKFARSRACALCVKKEKHTTESKLS